MKKDITRRVNATLQDTSKITLTLGNIKVGTIDIPTNTISTEPGFVHEGNRLFQYIEVPTPSSYVENCDLGWC